MALNSLTLSRRAALACLLAPAFVAALPAQAQTYPNKAVRIIVPFAAGTATDTLARLAGQHLADALKQPVVVDNRAGANGAIGADAVAKARADGYTLLVTTNTTQASNLSLMKSIPYDPQKDFAPVSLLGKGSFVLATRADAPFSTLAEFVTYARKNPGKVSYGSANSSGIISGATLALKSKLDLIHVPYKSGPAALSDVMGGQTSSLFVDIQSALPHLRSGKLKALGVTTAQAHPLLPGVSSLASAPGMDNFDLSYWIAVYAPAGTPRAGGAGTEPAGGAVHAIQGRHRPVRGPGLHHRGQHGCPAGRFHAQRNRQMAQPDRCSRNRAGMMNPAAPAH